MLKLVCLTFGIVTWAHAAKLPPILKTCAQDDPNYDECALAAVNEALPKIIKGDPKYRLSSLHPLVLPEIKLRPGELEIDFTDVKLFGFDKVKVLDYFHWDKEKMIATGKLHTPLFHQESQYKVKGRILVLPIHGEGQFESNMENLEVEVSYPVEFVDQPDGTRRLKLKEGTVKYKVSKASFKLENLFGDKALSDNMNKILNDNWEAVLKDIGEAVPVAMEAVIRSIVQALFIHTEV